MSLNVFQSLCNDDCDSVQFPALEDDQNCISFEDRLSQVAGILFVDPNGVMPTDWRSRSSWEAIVDNSLSDINAAKYIVGMGGVPAADKLQKEVAKNRVKTTRRTYTLTFTITNLSDLHYEFCRFLQCGGTTRRVWFETTYGSVFGGANGIRVSNIDADLPLGEGADDYEEGIIIITFDALVDPERATILNLSDNFTTGHVTPTNPDVWGSSPNNVWGSSPNNVWGT